MVRTAAFKSYSKVMAVSFLFLRHCERSEAIHERQARLDCFVASAPRKKVAQKRCHTTNIEPQTFIQGGSVPYPPVPTRNDAPQIPQTTSSSPRNAPEPLMNLPPKEGVGNAGCPLHPRPRVHLVVVERTRVTTSTPESPGIPARNGHHYAILYTQN